MTLFWTIHPDPTDALDVAVGSVTYCEEHALEATNEAMSIAGADAFGSMAEAYAVLASLAAIGGVELPMTSSEEGAWDECVHIATGPVHGAAAHIEESA